MSLIFEFQTKQPQAEETSLEETEQEEERRPLLISPSSKDAPLDTAVDTPTRVMWVNVVLLFVAAVLYDAAVVGAVELLAVFVIKEPLSWSATQVCVCHTTISTQQVLKWYLWQSFFKHVIMCLCISFNSHLCCMFMLNVVCLC